MKNNKGKINLVTEKSVHKTKRELANLTPVGGPVSTSTLALGALNVNNKIRYCGLIVLRYWLTYMKETFFYTDTERTLKRKKIIISLVCYRNLKLEQATPAAIPAAIWEDNLVVIKICKDK